MVEPRPFLGWPGWRHVRFTALLGLAVTAWWLLLYHGANAITERRAYRVRLHLDFELDVPFVPAAVLLYLSIYPVFWVAPFILRTRRETEGLALTLAAVIAVGFVGFLLFPADSAYPPPGDLGVWKDLVAFAQEVALPHNFLPSLHVAMCGACLLVYAGKAPVWGRWLLLGWLAGIALSTWLIHEHYLIDVVAGGLLAWLGVRLVYQRWVRGKQALLPNPTPCPNRSA
jgi:membrane-associated phospholipid phosphatase